MGILQLLLPVDGTGPPPEELKRACVAAGHDSMPFCTTVALEPGKLRLTYRESESGLAAMPWPVDKAGLLMTTTATLIERLTPYPLVVELARGKVNQLRNQAADWQFGGLTMPDGLKDAIHEATMSLGRAVARSSMPESSKLAQTAIAQAYSAADRLVLTYQEQVFQLRHQRQPRLETSLGCRLGAKVPVEPLSATLRETFNTVCVPLTWANVETREGEFNWEQSDQLFDWAITSGFHVVGGPLIDFAAGRVPPWMLQREKSLAGIAAVTSNYVATVVNQYKGRIRTWQLTSGGNASNPFGLNDDESLWLTLRLAETRAAGTPTPNC